MNILVTGGSGYIGSHTCIELLNAGHNLVVIDNFCNSSRESLRRIESINTEIMLNLFGYLNQTYSAILETDFN